MSILPSSAQGAHCEGRLPAERVARLDVRDHSRIASIDIGRALVVVSMIFMDELNGIVGTPAWLMHASSPVADAMTIRDYGFAAFLFLVGISASLALERRQNRGETTFRTLIHLFARCAGLLLISLLLANGDFIRHGGQGWAAGLWNLLALVSVFVGFARAPSQWKFSRQITIALRVVGPVLLLWLTWTYRDLGDERIRFSGFSSQVLALIGISYLVVSLIALAVRQRTVLMVGSLGGLIFVYYASRRSYFQGFSVDDSVDVGIALGSLPSIAMTGAIAWKVLYSRPRSRESETRIILATAYGMALALAASVLHCWYPINAIQATPSWALWCSAVSCWILTFLHWFLDARGINAFGHWLGSIGGNALTAYLLP
jgi:heparan-alpha-glucosaminide N-acetyltransferase